ncbi:helix-turn-helix domain-containing protein [Micromonospora sp. R77]|uniref:winged helix-turn-helix domain-containing protein n=1 Tax=Micromonospora sp. R77 TaxID=2925836 RepID=UPI0035B46DC9
MKSQTPVVDSTGVLRLGSRSTTISQAQVELLDPLIKHFKQVVYRQELEHRLARRATRPTRNSLDLHIMRLRRRVASVGLVIRTAWGRGYVLEPQPGTSDTRAAGWSTDGASDLERLRSSSSSIIALTDRSSSLRNPSELQDPLKGDQLI